MTATTTDGRYTRFMGDVLIDLFNKFDVGGADDDYSISEWTRSNTTDVWRFVRYSTELGHFDSKADAVVAAKAEARRRRIAAADARHAEGQTQRMRYPFDFANADVKPFLPARLPYDWSLILEMYPGDKHGFMRQGQYAAFHRVTDDLRVLMNYGVESGKRFLRVSALYPDRTPTWEEMCAVKDLFIGEHHHAMQVHPKKSDHVSISHNMLHMWVPLDGWPFPDLRRLM